MQEALVFPKCPFCEAAGALETRFEGGGGVTTTCRACGRHSYVATSFGERQEWPSGYKRNPSYVGELDIVKARSTWLCENAWNADGPIELPQGCRVVIRRNDMRLSRSYWHQVTDNICIRCSLNPELGFWLSSHAG